MIKEPSLTSFSASRMVAVAATACSSLAYEILLTRYFAIAQWNHLAFVAVSVAMFGIGASGVLMNILPKALISPRFWSAATIAYPLVAMGSYLIINSISLEFFRFALEPNRSTLLFAVFLILSLPFLVAGFVTAYAYWTAPKKSPSVYLVSMAGSTAGALLPWILIPMVGVGRSMLLSAGVAVVAIPCLIDIRRWVRYGISMAFIAFIALILVLNPSLIDVRMSSYKGLSQIMQLPDSHVVFHHDSMRVNTVVVQNTSVRSAPGLSLKSREPVPNLAAVFVDGGYHSSLVDPEGKPPAYARESLGYAAYVLMPIPEAILIIDDGGGAAISQSHASGHLDKTTIVISNPTLATMVASRYQNTGLTVVNENPRAYLTADESPFSLLVVDTSSGSLPGLEALNQQPILTVEAFGAYLQSCWPAGIISVERLLQLPPSDMPKLIATCKEALQQSGITSPERHIIAIRTYDRYVVLISPSPFSAGHGVLIRDFCSRWNFDIVYLSDMKGDEPNRYNRYSDPIYAKEVSGLFVPDPDINTHLDLRPSRDSRPYFSRFIKPLHLRASYEQLGSRGYSLLISGELLAIALLIVACVWSLLLLGTPRFIKQSTPGTAQSAIRFALVGSGYIFIELGLINAFSLPLGSGAVSFAVILPAMLIASGVGGYYAAAFKWITIKRVTLIISAVTVLLFVGVTSIAQLTLAWPMWVRLTVSISVAVLTALPMGVPFPVLMGEIRAARARANAWAWNGTASVVASIASVSVALSLGIPWLLILGGLAYTGLFIIELKQ